MFKFVSVLDGDFLMTYDDDEEVRRWAKEHRFDVCEIQMRSSHHKVMTELLIGRNLDWVREFQRGS